MLNHYHKEKKEIPQIEQCGKEGLHISFTSELPAGPITQAGNRNSASGPKGDASFQTGSDLESASGCPRLLV